MEQLVVLLQKGTGAGAYRYREFMTDQKAKKKPRPHKPRTGHPETSQAILTGPPAQGEEDGEVALHARESSDSRAGETSQGLAVEQLVILREAGSRVDSHGC
jgi:hypothetical protein